MRHNWWSCGASESVFYTPIQFTSKAVYFEERRVYTFRRSGFWCPGVGVGVGVGVSGELANRGGRCLTEKEVEKRKEKQR